MADTGFKTTGNVVSSAWTTPITTTRINTSDDSRALARGTAPQSSTVNNFAFGVPAGATIDGIEAVAEMSVSNASYGAQIDVYLSWNNGANWSAAKSDTSGTTVDADKTLGGAADLWGHSWVDSELADGTFLVQIDGRTNGAGIDCRLDFFRIKVYYTEAGGNTGSMLLVF